MVVSTGAAILGAAVIGGGAALIGGGQAARASREAAAVQAGATDQAIAEQRRQADISQANLAPFLATSTAANDALSRLFNLQPAAAPPPAAPGAPAPTATQPRGISFRGSAAGDFGPGDFDQNRINRFAEDGRVSFGGGGQNQALQNLGLIDTPVAGAPIGTEVAPGGAAGGLPTGLDVFQESPGFQFRRERGEQGLNRALASRGAFFSGQAVEDLTEFNSGLASQEFNNFFNRLNALRTGTSAAATTSTAAGAASSGNIANLIQTGGAARASGIVGAANAANVGLAGVSSALTGGINNALLNRGTTATTPDPRLNVQPFAPIQNPALNFRGG